MIKFAVIILKILFPLGLKFSLKRSKNKEISEQIISLKERVAFKIKDKIIFIIIYGRFRKEKKKLIVPEQNMTALQS